LAFFSSSSRTNVVVVRGAGPIGGTGSVLSFFSTSAWNPADDDAGGSDPLRSESSTSSSSSSRSTAAGGSASVRGYYEGEPIESQLDRFFHSASTSFSRRHVRELVNGACRMNTLRGMQLANDAVEKWILVTKAAQDDALDDAPPRRRRNRSSASTDGQDDDDDDDDRVPARPPMDKDDVASTTLDLWQQVLYGWSVMAPTHPVAVVRMREVVDRVVREAILSTQATSAVAADAGGMNFSSSQQQQGSRRSRPPPSNAPTVDLYNTYLFGLAQAAGSSRSAADKARDVLEEMEGHADRLGWWCRPNTKSYMSALVAHKNARHPNAGAAVLEILAQMIRAHNQQRERYEAQYGEPYRDGDGGGGDRNRRKIVTPDHKIFTVALQAVVQSTGDTRKYLQHLLAAVPTQLSDAKFWVTVIHAHARLVDQERSAAKRIEIASDAEQILRDYLQGSGARDDPDTVRAAWNACLDVWSRVHAAEAPTECERILQDMLSGEAGVSPDIVSFNACHHAWTKASGAKHHANAWERSLELLQLQIDLGDAASQPDYQSYALVVLACGNAHKIREARHVVDGMVARTRELASPMQRNPSAPFSSLLTSIAKASDSPAGKAASMSDADAWEAEEAGSDSLYDAALRTYAEVAQDLHGIGAKPDHHTFSAMLRCVAKHGGPGIERQTRAREVFDAACEAGEVSRTVVEALGMAIGDANTRRMIGDLPRFWSRNVPAGLRGHSRQQGPKASKSSPSRRVAAPTRGK
jgi:hypothetical protein